jgi:aminopeptidase C
MLEKRLRAFAQYLKDTTDNVDSYHDGHLESAIKYAKAEVMQEIGEMLEEVLDLSEENLTD